MRLNQGGLYLDPTNTQGGMWFRSIGPVGWHNVSYGGGIYMADTTFIRTYGSKSLLIDQNFGSTYGNIHLRGNSPTVSFWDTDNSVKWMIHCNADALHFHRTTTGTETAVDWVAKFTLDNTGRPKFQALSGTGTRAVYSDANGSLTNTASDSRLKHNISKLTYGLKEVLELNPVEFNWIDPRSGEHDIGLIAQEVNEWVPEVVRSQFGRNAVARLRQTRPRLDQCDQRTLQRTRLTQKENLMPDYKENAISGSSYQRAKTVILQNIQNEIPSAEFVEEIVYNLGDQTIRKDAGSLIVRMVDPDKSFPIRNHLTGEVVPDQYGTYGQIYVLLYSAYWDSATARDQSVPSIRIHPAQEKEEGLEFSFNVWRLGNLKIQSTVDWEVMGTGINPVTVDDFGGAFPGGSLVFYPNEYLKIVSFSSAEDAELEGDETFKVVLSNPVSCLLEIEEVESTVINDDTGV